MDNSPPPRLFRQTPGNLSGSGQERGNAVPTSSTIDQDHRRIFVVGLGNLGRLFATSLAKLPDRPPITLVVHRLALLKHWQANPGLAMTRGGVTEHDGSFEVEMWSEEPPPGAGPVREVADGDRIHNVVIATKAPVALEQIDRLRRYLGPESSVAFVQNGMNKLWPPFGFVYSEERFGKGQHPNWLQCVVTHGVTSVGPFHSVHASPADAVVGPVLLNETAAAAAHYLMGQIERAPYLAGRSVSRPELWVLQLEKLVVNSIINPLTSILRCKNGVLFDEPEGSIHKLMDLLIAEASRVLCRLVSHESSADILCSSDPAGALVAPPLTVPALLTRFSPTTLQSMLHRVGAKVRDNTSSMLQDLLAGKKTEIGEFNGWLIETAAFLDNSMDMENHKILLVLVERGIVLEKARLGNYFPALRQP